MAAPLPVRNCFIGTAVLQRRDAGRDWLEEQVPFGGSGMQSLAGGLSCRPLQGVAHGSQYRTGKRAVLSFAARRCAGAGSTKRMGVAGVSQPAGEDAV